MNFYGKQIKPLKANLHTHSTVSDGIFPLGELVRRYRDAGYDVLAFTDHGKTSQVSRLDGNGMTLLSGIELHPLGPRGIRWHLLALGIPENFSDCSGQSPQAVVNMVNRAGGICFAAHPYWCGQTAAEVMSLDEIAGIEVYNTSTRYIGKEYNMQLWDETLDAGKNYSALAVDDVHRETELFRGWSMLACEPTQEKILAALREGGFYSTEGPEFTSLTFEKGIFQAEFTPCQKAIIITNKCGGFGLFNEANGGEDITTISFDTAKLSKGSYLRCQICDGNGRFAWSNPIRTFNGVI